MKSGLCYICGSVCNPCISCKLCGNIVCEKHQIDGICLNCLRGKS